MLKLIGAKLLAWAAIAGAVLLAIVGYQRKVIKEQKHEIKIKDARRDIQEDQDKAIDKNTAKEVADIEKANKNNSNLSKRDKFKRL